MEILLITVIFADGKPIGDGSCHIKETLINVCARCADNLYRQLFSASAIKGLPKFTDKEM